MKRKKIVIANWKMNEDVDSSTALAKKIKTGLAKKTDYEVVICPDFVSLVPLYQLLSGTNLKLGAQDVAEEEKGAFTGEVSILTLKPYAKYVIVGHSERRNLIGEGDRETARKAEVAVRHKVYPIICAGETLHEKEDGLSRIVVLSQLEAACKHLTAGEIAKTIVAYEPIWSTGSGKVCEAEEVVKVAEDIRKLIKTLYGQKASEEIRIVYGGSIDDSNVSSFSEIEDLDGLLVGGASLHPSEFISIVKKFNGENK